jgi:hypothetical protein
MNLNTLYDNLIPKYVQKTIEQQRRFKQKTTSLLGRFENDILGIQRRLSEVSSVVEKFQRMYEDSERWAEALRIVRRELPKRGWYLTGQEPCTLTPRLAKLIEEENWTKVDEILTEEVADVGVDADAFATWLRQHSVPECCIQRIRIFLDARQNGQHDIATLVAIPTIDEVSRALYEGRDFMTKRSGRQTKPQMATTISRGSTLNHYCEGFVESFGVIHRDFEPERSEDEDYFNRHAILHGLMRRSYGPKDSAKAFILLMFIVFALDEDGDNGE